jgi:hypothetical protein
MTNKELAKHFSTIMSEHFIEVADGNPETLDRLFRSVDATNIRYKLFDVQKRIDKERVDGMIECENQGSNVQFKVRFQPWEKKVKVSC